MIKIAHLVNPVIPSSNSDLNIAQPVTFEAMTQAKHMANKRIEIDLIAATYPEDAAIIPVNFIKTEPLHRSVLDFGDFSVPRKLPLLRDLLQHAYDSSDADYIIYTNVDIAPLPHFYLAIEKLIAAGNDALVINRRTISDRWQKPDDYALMCAEIGSKHPGFDCFVLPRKLIPQLDLGDICIGIDRIGLVFLSALHVLSNQLLMVDDAHLTFHIGNDRQWRNPDLNDYYHHNNNAAKVVFKRLQASHGDFHRKLPSWAAAAAEKVLGEDPLEAEKTKKSGLLEKLFNRLTRTS